MEGSTQNGRATTKTYKRSGIRNKNVSKFKHKRLPDKTKKKRKKHWTTKSPNTAGHEYDSVGKRQDVVIDLTSRMKKMVAGKTDKLEICNKKLDSLINNKRNERITKVYLYGNKCAFSVLVGPRDIPVLYSGLTKRLKQIFYPEIEENPKFKRANGEIPKPKPYYTSKTLERTCELFGAEHGTKVHQEIEIFVKSFVRKMNGYDFFIQVEDPDPCTLRIINFLTEKKWIPVVSEHMIWDEDSRIATSIDLIVFSIIDCKLKIIELKTGYEGEIYGPSPLDTKFPIPFNEISNCCMFRHCLQLLSMMLILSKKYKLTITDGYIIRTMSKAKTIECISLPTWARLKVFKDNLYQCLIDSK